MTHTTINKSTAHFDTKLWNGDSNPITISGYEFQPDFVWIKRRNSTTNHGLYDAVRGTTKFLESSATSPEQTLAAGLTAFTSDGYTLGGAGQVSTGGGTYVGWNWKAGTGQGSSNTDGSINTTYTSVNTTAGFSISKYTGTGSNATIGHGLGVVPKMMIVKVLSTSNQWFVYHQALGNTKKLNLDDTSAESVQNNLWNDTTPTSSVFSVGNHTGVNASGATYVAYCFADVQGYSKVSGSYTGNGSASLGAFVYLGFKPAWVMIKRTNSADAWYMFDNKRQGYNPSNELLRANLSNAESTPDRIDLLSNGFKLTDSDGSVNGSGGTYIYMAFGQSLVGSNNVPCTAR